MKKFSMLAILFLFLPILFGCGANTVADKTGALETGQTATDSSEQTGGSDDVSSPDSTAPDDGVPVESGKGEMTDESQTGSETAESGANDIINQTEPMPMTIDKTKKYSAVLKTEAGDITVALMADKTPITVNNFVSLARKNFYDNVIFHRVIKDFMIQSGDPKGDGTGGPGYRFEDEPFEGEYTRGVIAMANAGPDTNGSQFFIMHKDVPLPKNYVIFGSVTMGLDAVDKIAEGAVELGASGEKSKPVTPVKINSVEIIEE